MPAPDLVTLYDLETNVEPHVEALLESRIVLPGGASVLGSRTAAQATTPRIECQLIVGQAAGQKYPRGTQAYYNAWNVTLLLSIVTARLQDNVPDTAHGSLRAQVRYLMQPAAEVFRDAFPYHSISKQLEMGTNPSVDAPDDLDVSRLTFACIIAVRTDAWPPLVPPAP